MKVSLALSLLMAVASASADRYEIAGLSTTQQYAYFNNAWLNDVPCIQVTLKVNEDIGKRSPEIKAYFFNKDREMVKECGKPTHISQRRQESFQAPESYKPGKKYSVYFGIPESIRRGKEKWKYVLVVFGDREAVTAAIHPKEDIQQFEFKEKRMLGTNPARPASKQTP